MIVRYLMSTEITTLAESLSCTRAHHILTNSGFRHAPVMRGERLAGMIAERDIARALTWEVKSGQWRVVQQQPTPWTVGEVMNRDVLTADPADHVEDVADLMLRRKISAVPVVEKRKLVGLLTETDILCTIAKLEEQVRVQRVTFQAQNGAVADELALVARCIGEDSVLRRLNRYHTPADSIVTTVHVSGSDLQEIPERLKEAGCRVIDVRQVEPGGFR